MRSVNIYKIDVGRGVEVSVNNSVIDIKIPGMNKMAHASYTPEFYEIVKNARFRIPSNDETRIKYKYPYSNEYGLNLHVVVFDYYFGEENRKRLWNDGFIIEHLDNNGFNCNISNLFVLLKVKNTYKGWNYDKLVEEAKAIIALRIYHIFENQTFQITMGLNQAFTNSSTRKTLQTVRLLYDYKTLYDYEIVLQDAEQILEGIYRDKRLNFDEWCKFRYKDIEIKYDEDIVLTEEEKKQSPGTIVLRNGVPYLLLGISDKGVGLIHSVPIKEDWK